MQSVTHVLAVPGRGIEGDRYSDERGTWSRHPGTGRQVTLIESEVLEALARDYGVELAAAVLRRNIVTAGAALNHFVGREFRAGEARLRGMRPCDPCAYLERLSAPGILRALAQRGGLRADVLSGGIIRVGDLVAVSPAAR